MCSGMCRHPGQKQDHEMFVYKETNIMAHLCLILHSVLLPFFYVLLCGVISFSGWPCSLALLLRIVLRVGTYRHMSAHGPPAHRRTFLRRANCPPTKVMLPFPMLFSPCSTLPRDSSSSTTDIELPFAVSFLLLGLPSVLHRLLITV